uniref:Uncharacterized protein n=1 Tax=Oryzias latipes TaxID=8090 RepID=A0A3P9JR66_ORYLA
MSLTSITFTCICSDPDLEGLPPSTAVRTREITDCFSRSKAVFNTNKPSRLVLTSMEKNSLGLNLYIVMSIPFLLDVQVKCNIK